MTLARDLATLLTTLSRERIPHMVVGGIAVEALGVPRTTIDVDIQVDLPHPPPVTTQYFLGWFIGERSQDTVFGQDAIILEGPSSGVPFELFVTTHWFTRQALDRRITLKSAALGHEIPLPTPEDFILLKAAYARAKARDPRKANQDLLDIKGVVQAHPTGFDRTYVEANAHKLGVWDDIRRLL